MDTPFLISFLKAIKKILKNMATFGQLKKSCLKTSVGPLSPPVVRVNTSYGNDIKSNWGKVSETKVDQIKNLKETLGTNFKIIEELRDHYVNKIDILEKKIDDLEEKNKELIEKMESYLVGIPPIPDPSEAVDIVDSIDLVREAIKTDSYKEKYMNSESTSNMHGRIELIAYLDIVRGFGDEEYNIDLKPGVYLQSAIDNVDDRVNFYMMDARIKGISLAKYINDMVLPGVMNMLN